MIIDNLKVLLFYLKSLFLLLVLFFKISNVLSYILFINFPFCAWGRGAGGRGSVTIFLR